MLNFHVYLKLKVGHFLAFFVVSGFVFPTVYNMLFYCIFPTVCSTKKSWKYIILNEIVNLWCFILLGKRNKKACCILLGKQNLKQRKMPKNDQHSILSKHES